MLKSVKTRKVLRSLKTIGVTTSILGLGLLASDAALAAQSLGGVASQITSSFTQVTALVTGGSYLAGLAFSIGAIMKFKMHKDNPQQVPIGTPIALLFIAAALLFLPSVLGVAGETLFKGGQTSGPSGATFKVSGG